MAATRGSCNKVVLMISRGLTWQEEAKVDRGDLPAGQPIEVQGGFSSGTLHKLIHNEHNRRSLKTCKSTLAGSTLTPAPAGPP